MGENSSRPSTTRRRSKDVYKRQAYDAFDFHIVFHAIHNYCTIDLSNFYLDVIKDRLYTEAAESRRRRAAQSAMYRILRDLTLLVAPILGFTCLLYTSSRTGSRVWFGPRAACAAPSRAQLLKGE